jgi:hydroxymethylglutaryl-CoA lyase
VTERASDLPASVDLVEVGPRDGLQAISTFIPTEAKVRLIRALADTGHRFIEATSFVSPRAVPQMRDAVDVASALDHTNGVLYSALVPNLRGLEAALEADLRQIGVLAAATESYSLHNTNTSIEGSLARIGQILTLANLEGVSVRGYVSCAVSCPYEGPVEAAWAAELAGRLLDLGCDEVVLGDTTGRGTVATVGSLIEETLNRVPADRLGVHFHDTYGQGLANLVVALRYGVRKVDVAFAGLGGSPSAPGAGGNLATEDVLYLLDGMEIGTGVDVTAVAAIGEGFCAEFHLPNASRAGSALADAQRRERDT